MTEEEKTAIVNLQTDALRYLVQLLPSDKYGESSECEIIERALQSITSLVEGLEQAEDSYMSAVKGRREFRQMYRDMKKDRDALREEIEGLKKEKSEMFSLTDLQKKIHALQAEYDQPPVGDYKRYSRLGTLISALRITKSELTKQQ